VIDPILTRRRARAALRSQAHRVALSQPVGGHAAPVERGAADAFSGLGWPESPDLTVRPVQLDTQRCRVRRRNNSGDTECIGQSAVAQPGDMTQPRRRDGGLVQRSQAVKTMSPALHDAGGSQRPHRHRATTPRHPVRIRPHGKGIRRLGGRRPPGRKHRITRQLAVGATQAALQRVDAAGYRKHRSPFRDAKVSHSVTHRPALSRRR
jgi:hypothetical protein